MRHPTKTKELQGISTQRNTLQLLAGRTQYPHGGPNWANTFVTTPLSFKQAFHQPAMDLVVYHAPRPDRHLVVTNAGAAGDKWQTIPYKLRYTWEGMVQPRRPYAFTHLLLPTFPTAPEAKNPPAEGITVLADDAEHSVWRIRTEKDREEWVVLNADGKAVEVDGLSTDARQVYVDLRGGKPARVLATDGTHLTVAGNTVFRQAERGDVEK